MPTAQDIQNLVRTGPTNPQISISRVPGTPQTQPLPYMAVGRTAQGEPYYGDGLRGWVRKIYGKVFDPGRYSAPTEQGRQAVERLIVDNQTHPTLNMVTKLIWEGAKEYFGQDVVEEMSAGAKETAASMLSDKGQIPELIKNMMWEGGKESLFGGFYAIGEAPFRNVFSQNLALDEIADTYSVLPDRAEAEDPNIRQLQHFFYGGANTPLNISYNQARIFFGKLRDPNQGWKEALKSLWSSSTTIQAHSAKIQEWITGETNIRPAGFTEEEARTWLRNMDASGMVYTAWIDDATRYEAQRRIEAGESPSVVTMELQNPWAELLGGMVFDLTNLFDIPGFIDPATKFRRFNSAADDILRPVDAEAFNELRKAGDAAGDIETSRGLSTFFKRIQDGIRGRTTRFQRMANDYRLLSGTADAKRWVTNKRVGMAERAFMGFFKNDPEQGVEAISHLLRATSDNSDEAYEAIAWLARSPAGKVALSNAGYDLMAVLRRTADEFGGIDNLYNAVRRTSSMDELGDILSPRLERAIDGMFPSVNEMKKASQLRDVGRATEEQLRLAGAYDDISRSVKFWNEVNNKFEKVYKPFNTFFAYVYMGFNPGYAVRNLLTDTTTIWVEEGTGAAGRNLVDRIKDLWKGSGFRRQADNISKMTGIDDIAEKNPKLFAGLGPHAGEETAGRPFAMRMANAAERGSSATIVEQAVRREMTRAMRSGMLPDIDSIFRNIGLSQADAELYRKIFFENWGDVRKTNRAFLEIIGRGREDVWRRIPLPRKLRQMLGQLNGSDEMLEEIARTAESPEDFRRMLDEYISGYDSLASRADSASRRFQQLDRSAAEAYGNTAIDEAFSKGLIDSTSPEDALFRLRGAAMDVSRKSTDDAVEEARKLFRSRNIDTFDLDTALRNVGARTSNDYRRVSSFWDQCIQKGYIPVRDAMRNGKTVTSDQMRDILKGLYFTPPRGATQRIDNIPEVVDYDTFRKLLFDFWRPHQLDGWRQAAWGYSENSATAIMDFARRNGIENEVVNTPRWWTMTRNLEEMEVWFSSNSWDDVARMYAESMRRAGVMIPGNARLSNLDSRTLRYFGWPRGQRALFSAVNADRRTAGLAEYAATNEVPWSECLDAITKRIGEGKISLLSPLPDDMMPTMPYFLRVQQGMVEDEINRWADNIASQWGQTRNIHSNPRVNETLDRLIDVVEPRRQEAVVRSLAIGQAERDWILHDYKEKKYFDLALSKIFPYHFWYSRSYPKWISRLVEKPQIIARYAKYRRFLEQIHAGLPTWWKYNLSTNDLPGVDMENPLYFNIEALLNPLNGLTGIDFDDPYRRTTWYSRLVDDMGRFGPSVWTPVQWLVAAKLYQDGEEEASRRWMGRLIPQTATLKGLLYKAGMNTGLFNNYNEFDPFVAMFHGGLDPYERRRVGRALGAMVDSGEITAEQAQDAARVQSGPIWEDAVRRSQEARFPGQLSSFFFGAGGKGRTKTDIQIDNFYNEYWGLMRMRPNLSPREFSDAMTALREKYPWMEVILISKKPDDERDAAYAYAVMNRIAPGQMTELAEAAGINPDLLDQFYDQKGTFEGWTPQDIDRFMAGMADLGALLSIPDSATRYEWNAAREAYSMMQGQLEQNYGPDITDKIDYYYSLEREEKDAYLAQYPEVRTAMESQTRIIIQTPLLYQYYGGIDSLNRYWNSWMYRTLEQEFGPNIQSVWDTYYTMQLENTRGASAFYRQHPELRRYRTRKAELEDYINREIARFDALLPDQPQVAVRSDFVPQGPSQESLANAAIGQPQPTWADWQNILSEPMQRLLLAYYVDGETLPSVVRNQLDYMAQDYGYPNGEAMLQAIGSSIYSGR